MSDQNNPDRAHDFDDIPTYEGNTAANNPADQTTAAEAAQGATENAAAQRSGAADSQGASLDASHEDTAQVKGQEATAVSVSQQTDQQTTPAPKATLKDAVYQRAGRVAPQQIDPAPTAQQPAQQLQQAQQPASESEQVAPKAAPAPATEVFEQSSSARNAPLASDAPTSYHDDDFAAPQQHAPAYQASAAQESQTPTQAAQAASIQGAQPYQQQEFQPQTYQQPYQPQGHNDGQYQQYYAQGGAPATVMAPAPEAQAYQGTEAAGQGQEEETAQEAQRRGTIDFGLLLLRLLFGGWLIWDSIRVFFNLGNSGGLSGLEASYGGYAWAHLLSIAVPTVELTAGVFLLIGLLTPLATALATVATSFLFLDALNVSDGLSAFNLSDTVVLGALTVGLSLVLQFTGPGTVSLDASRSWARRPLASSWLFAILGIAGAVALWWFGAAVNPLH